MRTTLIISALCLTLCLAAGQSQGSVISSFSELLESGYISQQIQGNDAEFIVGGSPVTSFRYYGGLLDENGYVVGHFTNSSRNFDKVSGEYNGDPSVPVYENVLSVGEKPASCIAIEDTDADGIIGDLTGGVFTVDSGDRYWLTADIEFGGELGVIGNMPAYTGTSDTLTVPSINLIPEPLTLSVLALGGAGLLLRRKR